MKRIITLILCLVLCLSVVPVQAKCKINPKHKKVISKELGGLDYIKKVDGDKKHKWYVYYVYAHGDIYIITIVKGKTDIFQQLN